MDDNSKFTLIAKRILQELRALSQAVSTGFLGVQKQVESIAKQQYAENERENTLPVLRAELQIPEAIERNRERQNHKKVWREWIAIGVSVLTLFAIVAYAIINYHMLSQMRREADAAKQSADAASRAITNNTNAFITEERAYIRILPGEIFNDPFDPGKLAVNIPYENYGKTDGLIIGFDKHARGIKIRRDQRNRPSLGEANIKSVLPQVVPETIISPNIQNLTTVFGATKSVEETNSFKRLETAVQIYGCIEYLDLFEDSPHWTDFCTIYTAAAKPVNVCQYKCVHKDNQKAATRDKN
jgi:hypothetical protein